jgi:hypothetical protein
MSKSEMKRLSAEGKKARRAKLAGRSVAKRAGIPPQTQELKAKADKEKAVQERRIRKIRRRGAARRGGPRKDVRAIKGRITGFWKGPKPPPMPKGPGPSGAAGLAGMFLTRPASSARAVSQASDKKQGSWGTRFLKMSEELMGLPKGVTGRPETKKEKTRRHTT